MSSKSPERKPKTMSQKPLNPDVTSFPIPPLAARHMSGTSLSTPITNHHLVPQGVVVPQQATTLAHNNDNQVVLFQYQMQPNALLVMGYGYAQPGVFVAHHPVSIPVHTSISPPHPIDQKLESPIDSSGNEDRLDYSRRGSHPEWEDKEIYRDVETKTEVDKGGQVQLEWRVKRSENYPIGNVPFPPTLEEAKSSKTTSLMVKNLSNNIQLKDILAVLDDHCSQQNKAIVDRADWSLFDFVHLPMDFRKHSKRGKMSNLGYAFVNFTTPRAAFKFYQQYHENGWCGDENKKCKITAAHIQGKEALVDQFSRKVYRCKSPYFLPLVFSEPRDGFNRQSEGALLGRFVESQPRKTLASWVSPKVKEPRPTSSSHPSSSSHEIE